jgi:ubiquinone/menaquinone biosynthesis C-methylase UbiE
MNWVSAISKMCGRLPMQKPDDRVLDVGCGIGRVALHFARFLGEHGRYDGFDAVRVGVDW